jgi:3-phosphoglycerate kinase
MLEKAKGKGVALLLPDDIMVGDRFAPDCERKVVDAHGIPDGWMGLSIGPVSVQRFTAAVKGAGTVVWNGPMGVFEFPAFAESTKAMAKALAESEAVTIVGGGDSFSAVEQMGYADKITLLVPAAARRWSFLAGKELPGIACLMDA